MSNQWHYEQKGESYIKVDTLHKIRTLETELAAVTEQRDAVTLRLGDTQVRMFDAERQRDRLTKAIEPLKYWRDISECDCSNTLPQGGCLRCDLDKILNLNQPTP